LKLLRRYPGKPGVQDGNKGAVRTVRPGQVNRPEWLSKIPVNSNRASFSSTTPFSAGLSD